MEEDILFEITTNRTYTDDRPIFSQSDEKLYGYLKNLSTQILLISSSSISHQIFSCN
jgi:hypothetical protein